MKKKLLLLAGAVCFVSLFISAGLFAGSTAPDVIKMKDKAYGDDGHTKGICEFQHKKHAKERDLKCGDCHHDDKGVALELKEGDNVKLCIECHKKPGEKPKGEAEKLEYHAEAMHGKCKKCHKTYNKKNNTKAAPTTCSGCHPKAN